MPQCKWRVARRDDQCVTTVALERSISFRKQLKVVGAPRQPPMGNITEVNNGGKGEVMASWKRQSTETRKGKKKNEILAAGGWSPMRKARRGMKARVDRFRNGNHYLQKSVMGKNIEKGLFTGEKKER